MVNLFHFVAGFSVFTLIVLGGVMMINDVQTNYPEANMSDEDFGEIYNSFNMTQNVTESVTGDVLQGEIDDTGVIGSITKGSFKALKQVRLSS